MIIAITLLAALLFTPPHGVTSCQDIQLYFGHLSSSLEIASDTLLPPATSCNCCGRCHRNPLCKSFMFSTSSRQCILYGTTGGPEHFTRERTNSKEMFFFLPGRSQTNEFCRSDSDCVTDGDFCRGRICTTDDTVTCRDYYMFNNELRSERYWGFIAGREILLDCSMGRDGGYTKLVFASPSNDWAETNRLNSTTYGSDGTARTTKQYSILW